MKGKQEGDKREGIGDFQLKSAETINVMGYQDGYYVLLYNFRYWE